METYVKPPRTGMEAFEMMPEGTFCQLINNVIVVSPASTPSHQSVSGNIYDQLKEFVKKEKAGKVFYSPIDVFLNDENAFQPDIVFVSSAREEIINWSKGIMAAPDLVIEILSPGKKKYDLNKKKGVYEQCAVQEYWVVDPETSWCEGFYLEKSQYKSLGTSTGHITICLLNLPISF